MGLWWALHAQAKAISLRSVDGTPIWTPPERQTRRFSVITGVPLLPVRTKYQTLAHTAELLLQLLQMFRAEIHCRNHALVLPVIGGVDCSCTPSREAELRHCCSEKEAAKDEQPESVKPISDHLGSRSQHGHLPLSSRRNPSRVIFCPATGSTYCGISCCTPP